MTGEEAPEGLGSGREEGRKGGGWADVDEVRPVMDAMEAARGVGACSGSAWSVPGFRIEFSATVREGRRGWMQVGRRGQWEDGPT